jgi:hypothetical protein
VRSAWSNSLSAAGRVALVAFIASASSAVTTLTTNSSVSRTFRAVSLRPSSPSTGANITTGGAMLTTLKNE